MKNARTRIHVALFFHCLGPLLWDSVVLRHAKAFLPAERTLELNKVRVGLCEGEKIRARKGEKANEVQVIYMYVLRAVPVGICGMNVSLIKKFHRTYHVITGRNLG